MKKMENSFAVTGFVGKDASIHQFTTASVARFSLAISRNEKNGVEGYFKPEEWQDAEGVKHNRVILVATNFYAAVEKENTPDSQQGKTQKDK